MSTTERDQPTIDDRAFEQEINPDLQPAIDTAIDVLVHRATIEQAKGALMLAHGITPDAAFDLLRTASQVGNTKLHTLAERFVARLAEDVRRPVDPAAVDGMLADATWAAT